MKNLETYKVFTADKINLFGIKKFMKLKTVQLSSIGKIEGWKELLNCTNLIEFDYNGHNLDILDFKDANAPLSNLTIHGDFSTIDNLGNLPALKELDIKSEKKYAKLNITSKLESLTRITLQGNFHSINGLENAENLLELETYSSVKIKDTKFLSDLMTKYGFKRLEDGVYLK